MVSLVATGLGDGCGLGAATCSNGWTQVVVRVLR
jgi:hypothetical protein